MNHDTFKPIGKILLATFASLVLVFSHGMSVFAATDPINCPPNGDPKLPCSNKYYTINNIIFYDPRDQGEAPCTAEGGLGLLGGKPEEQAFRFLLARAQNSPDASDRLTAEQVAGMIGNFIVESVGVDPTMKQYGGGPGRGIAQWSVNDRWAEFLVFARTNLNNADPWTLAPQLEWVWHELHAKESASFTDLKKQTTASAAAESFMWKYERPNPNLNVNKLADRKKEAERVLREYGGGGTGSANPEPSTPTSGCNSGDSTGGVGTADGLTFPLMTNQNAITSHKPYPWCHQKQTSCHHDYKAADIMIDTGTVVIAAKAGKVMSVKNRNGSPGNAAIKTNGSGELYYYQHMSASTVKVRDGQAINQGQEIGRVGDSKDAIDTPPHLHFDILPSNYEFRPSCTGAGCRSLPFIDPQPALIKAFNALPKG